MACRSFAICTPSEVREFGRQCLRSSAVGGRQPLIELCQKFIKPKCEPANADFLLIRPSVRVNARAIRIVLCVCQDEPPEFDYKRVNVHRILSIHNVEVRGATRLYRGASPRDVLHNPRESVVVRIGIGRKASFYSQ